VLTTTPPPTRIVIATAPKYSRRKKPRTPQRQPLNGSAIVSARNSLIAPREQAPAMTVPPDTLPTEPAPIAVSRVVKARKPGSRPYLSLNIATPPADPDADRKLKEFFRRMMPHRPDCPPIEADQRHGE
jgi:hypothetical protein